MFEMNLTPEQYNVLVALINNKPFNNLSSLDRLSQNRLISISAIVDMIKNRRNKVFIVGDRPTEQGQNLLNITLFKVVRDVGFDFIFRKIRKQRNNHLEVTFGIELEIKNIENFLYIIDKEIVKIYKKQESRDALDIKTIQ